jgi:hypothetical protein
VKLLVRDLVLNITSAYSSDSLNLRFLFFYYIFSFSFICSPFFGFLVFQFFLCFPFSYLVFYRPSLFTFLSLKTHVSFISMLLKLFGIKSL